MSELLERLGQSKSGDKSANEIEYVPYCDESEMRDKFDMFFLQS